jgi:hypothetical protein
LLEVSWRATSPSGKMLTCGLYRGPAGRVEVRVAYAHDNLIRSALVHDVPMARELAAAWKDATIASGVAALSTSDDTAVR